MELTPRLLSELQRRLKVGNRRGVHLNAIPGNSRYKFDLSRLAYLDKNLPTDFVDALLSDMPLKFRISWKDNVPDLNTLLEEDQAQLVRITKSFENLIDQTEAIESEKGINTFGFGYPILVRRDQADGKLTIAPIIIWTLRIKRSKEFNTWEIQRNEDDSIYVNEVLINHLQNDSKIEVDPIPSEMLDDGLITKDELMEICVKLSKEIDTTVSSNLNEIFATKLDRISSIGDRPHYEKLIGNSTKPFIEFGGLFSIFEVQKQNIIEDYDNLMLLKGLSIGLDDLENHTFQPISAIETDPSQQSILHSLETKRNILIQGPPGTGKSQTLFAILVNALQNHKKVLVVCEKRTALEVLYNALVEKGLDNDCLLVRDIEKDRRVAVDSVKERIEMPVSPKSRYTSSKASLHAVLRKAAGLIELINRRHRKLDERLLTDKSWTTLVGTLLSQLRDLDDDGSLQIDHADFKYTSTELDGIIDLVEQGQPLYEAYKPYESNPFFRSEKLAGDNPYMIEKEIHDCFEEYGKALHKIRELETKYKHEYFSLREVEVRDQAQTGKKLKDFIKRVSVKYSENPTFLNEKKTTTIFYKVATIFSGKKRELIRDRRNAQKAFEELSVHLATCSDLPDFKLSTSLKSNLAKVEELDTLIETTLLKLPARLQYEYKTINLLKFALPQYRTESLKLFQEGVKELQERIRSHGWTVRNLASDVDHFFVTQLEQVINEKVEYFSGENDRFAAEYYWFNYYNGLSDELKTIVDKLKSKKDWGKTFLVSYLNQLLLNTASTDLPSDDRHHRGLDSVLAGLEKVQMKYIRDYWHEKQVEAKEGFEQRNPNLSVGNLYNKRKSHRFKKLSLRQIAQYDADLFTTFFPIVLTSPDVCCNLFKGKNEYFDIVMFDEASQLRIEDNLPAALKGKQVIIAGDEHQMPPSNYFSKVFEGTIEDEDEAEEEEEIVIDRENILLSCESLLELGIELNFEKRHLDFHYRSKHPYLIDFSNHAFYSQRLKPLPNTFDYTPIKYVQVSGTFSDHINDAEADMVLSILENNIQRLPNGAYPTVGIATFNITQRNHIKSKILQRQKFAKYAEFNAKVQELEEDGMFIKNLENIQGDERDVIILSTTYGPDKDGRFAQRFGPINHSKGYKLLNVIITRAKYKIYACSSIPESTFMNYNDFLVTEGSNNKRAVFYAYLAYCKAVGEGDHDSRIAILNALAENSKRRSSFNITDLAEADSIFEEEVYQRLLEEFDETRLTLQYKVSEFRIDIVYDPKVPGLPRIAIECDGAKYHSSREAYLHDLHRQKILERCGFVFHRIWSTNWWRNPEKEKRRLIEFIKDVESKPHHVTVDHSKTACAFTDDIASVENYVAQASGRDKRKEVAAIKSIERVSEPEVQSLTERINVGSKAIVKYLNSGKDMHVHIVDTAYKKDSNNGFQKITSKSPLAASIIGRSVGDIVKVGNLDNYVEIVKVER